RPATPTRLPRSLQSLAMTSRGYLNSVCPNPAIRHPVMNRFLPGFLGIALLALSACTSPEAPDGTPSETTEPTALTQEQQRAVEAIAALDEMRSGLARTISADEDVNAETFARVCRPVG